jgi:hypothetical protein
MIVKWFSGMKRNKGKSMFFPYNYEEDGPDLHRFLQEQQPLPPTPKTPERERELKNSWKGSTAHAHPKMEIWPLPNGTPTRNKKTIGTGRRYHPLLRVSMISWSN